MAMPLYATLEEVIMAVKMVARSLDEFPLT